MAQIESIKDLKSSEYKIYRWFFLKSRTELSQNRTKMLQNRASPKHSSLKKSQSCSMLGSKRIVGSTIGQRKTNDHQYLIFATVMSWLQFFASSLKKEELPIFGCHLITFGFNWHFFQFKFAKDINHKHDFISLTCVVNSHWLDNTMQLYFSKKC